MQPGSSCVHCRHCGWLAVCLSVCLRAQQLSLPPRSSQPPASPGSEHPCFAQPETTVGAPRENGAARRTPSSSVGFGGVFFWGGDATARVQRSSLGNLISRGGRLRKKKKKKNDRRHQLFCGHICVKKHQAVSCGFGVLPFLFPSPEV